MSTLIMYRRNILEVSIGSGPLFAFPIRSGEPTSRVGAILSFTIDEPYQTNSCSSSNDTHNQHLPCSGYTSLAVVSASPAPNNACLHVAEDQQHQCHESDAPP